MKYLRLLACAMLSCLMFGTLLTPVAAAAAVLPEDGIAATPPTSFSRQLQDIEIESSDEVPEIPPGTGEPADVPPPIELDLADLAPDSLAASPLADQVPFAEQSDGQLLASSTQLSIAIASVSAGKEPVDPAPEDPGVQEPAAPDTFEDTSEATELTPRLRDIQSFDTDAPTLDTESLDSGSLDSGSLDSESFDVESLDSESLKAIEPLATMTLDDGAIVEVVVPGQQAGSQANLGETEADNQREALGRSAASHGPAPSGGVEFADLLPEVDVHIAAHEAGTKLTYEYANATVASQATYEALRLPEDWTAVQRGNAIEVTDWRGIRRLVWAGGPVWDSPADGGANNGSTATVELVSFDAGVAVARINVDAAWLSDDARTYPVFVDPVIVDFSQTENVTIMGQLGSSPYDAVLQDINALNGNFTFSRTDISLESVTNALGVTRVYNSRSPARGAFGEGFTFNFDMRLERFGSDAIVFMPNGQVQAFTKDISGLWYPKAGTSTELLEYPRVQNLPGHWDLWSADGSGYRFTADGRLSWIEDVHGNRLNVEWNDAGTQINRVVDEVSSRSISFDWALVSTQGLNELRLIRATVQDPSNSAATSSWDYEYVDGLLSKVCDARRPVGGHRFCEQYDWGGQIQSMATKRAIARIFESGNADRADPVVKIGYVPEGWGRVGWIERSPASDTAHRTTFAYGTDANDIKSTTVTDARGNQWQYRFDENDRLISKDSPDGGGGLRSNYSGITRYEYDIKGQRTKVITPHSSWQGGVNATQSFEYDDDGNLTREIDGNNHSTWYFYKEGLDWKGLGLAFRTWNLTHTCPHLSGGNQNSSYCTKHDYDERNRRMATTTWQSAGRPSTTRWSHNTNGQVTSRTDQAGRTTTYEFLTVDQPNVGRRGDLRLVIHPSGLTDQFQYNAWGNTHLHSQFGGGQPMTLISTRNYNEIGLNTVERGALATNPVTGESTQHQTEWIYDANNRVVERRERDTQNSDSLRTWNFTYDRLGRETSSLGPAYVPSPGDDAQRPLATRAFDAVGNVIETCDPNGTCTTTTYNNRNQPQASSTGGIRQSLIEYYDSGMVRKVTDAENRASYFNYDLAGRLWLERERDAGGPWEITQRLSYQRGTDRVTRRGTGGLYPKHRLGLDVTAMYYTHNGWLRQTVVMQDGSAPATDTTYTDDGMVATVTDRLGSAKTKTSFTYDETGSVSEVVADVDGLALSTRTENDAWGRPVRITDPEGGRVDLAYDANGRIIRSTEPTMQPYNSGSASPGAPVRPTTEFGWDAWGNQTHVRDQNANETKTVFDHHDRVSFVRYPTYLPITGSAVVYASEASWYDANGNLTRLRDRRGGVTSFTYDVFNRVTRTRQPKAQQGGKYTVTTFKYDKVGNVIEQTDPTGAVTTNTWNRRNQPTSETKYVRPVTLSTGNETGERTLTSTSTYDTRGNMVSSTTPGGLTTTYTHDKLQRITSQTDPGGQTTTWTYDHLSNPVRIDAPGGFSTFRYHDGLGRLVSEDTRGPDRRLLTRMRYEYDGNGNVTSQKTRGNRVVNFTYDKANRLLSTSVPTTIGADSPAVTATFGYDKAGNQTYLRDANNEVTLRHYNSWHLLDQIVEPSTTAHPDLESRRFQYEYDKAGQLLVRTEPEWNVTAQYDGLGRLVSEIGSGDGWREIDYDANGRVTAMRSNGAAEQTFTFNDLGLLRESTGPAGRTIIGYDQDSRPTRRDDPSGVVRFTWTDRGQMASHEDPVTGLTSDFTWNDASQIELVKAGNLERRFGYRGGGSLLKEELYEGNARRQYTSYSYDTDLNVTSSSINRWGEGWSRQYFTYDGANRLTKWADQEYTGSWATSPQTVTDYTYDNAGNRLTETTDGDTNNWTYDERNRLTSGPEGTYRWDARGTLQSIKDGGETTFFDFDDFAQMTAVRRPDGAINYNYDALGRVDQRTASGGTSDFEYIGLMMDPVSDGTTTFGRSPSGNLTSLEHSNGTARVVGLDRFGDVSFTSNTNGRPKSWRLHEPFGEVLREWSASNEPDNNVGFQGDWTDPTTGDVNMGARWYSPTSATFRSRDVFNGDLTRPISLNRYTYGGNNPITYWDPTGYDYNTACNCYEVYGTTSEVNTQRFYDDGRATQLTSVGGDPFRYSETTTFGSGNAIATISTRTIEYEPQWSGVAPYSVKREVLYDGNNNPLASSVCVPTSSFGFASSCSGRTAAGTSFSGSVMAVGPDEFERSVIEYQVSQTESITAVQTYTDADAVATLLSVMNADEQAAFAHGVVGQNFDAFDTGKHNDGKVDGNISPDDFEAMLSNKHGNSDAASKAAARILLGNGGYEAYKTQSSVLDTVVSVASFAVEFVPFYDCLSVARDIGSGNVGGGTALSAAGCAADFVGVGVAADIGRGAARIADSARAADRSSGARRAACSFSGDTKVLMGDGSHVTFDELDFGDEVWAHDPESGVSGARAVVGIWPHADTVYDVAVADGTVVVTENHPFWNATDGTWEGLEDFDADDQVLTVSGEMADVGEIDYATAQTTTAWDITVEGLHTFYVEVGESDILVHNCGGTPANPVPDRMTPDQEALKDLVNEATSGGRRPLPVADAETVLDWAEEISYPWRAKAGDVSSPSNWVGGPHIHLHGAGRSGHVPVEPGVRPR